MGPRAVSAVSIDVDGIDCYYRIHGLGTPPPALADVIAQKALPRFLRLFASRDIKATFFFVARDVERDGLVRDLARALVADGHEIGNHSYSHPYHLARMPTGVMGAEIERAHHILSELAGAAIVGFRAPGYDLSRPMLAHLLRLGYRYDSSLFPAPGYYTAKAAMMAALALMRRPSGAVLTDPRALVAPADPYRPRVDAPWRRGHADLVELPIAVTAGARLPAIGTSLLLAPAPVRRLLIAMMAPRRLFNFEVHAIDLCDSEMDRIPAELVARQPDLRVPLALKEERLQRALDQIARSRDFSTLREVADGEAPLA